MSLPPGKHKDELDLAIGAEGAAQRALMSGDRDVGRRGMRTAADHYRASWEHAPPKSYGRLVGLAKAATIGGAPDDAAGYVRSALPNSDGSPVAAYALAIAGAIVRDARSVHEQAAVMTAAGGAFARTADALVGIVDGDATRYRVALEAILADFAARDTHLTGVAIADTALMLELIAARDGHAAHIASTLLPPD